MRVIRPYGLALSALALLSLLPSIAQADSRTWTGAVDALWSNPANWDTGTPAAGDSMVFDDTGASRVMVNDLPAGTTFGGLTFSATGYVLGGNGFVATSGISGAGDTVITAPVTAGGNQTIGFVALDGGLDAAGFDVTLTDGAASGDIVSVSGTVTVVRSVVTGNVSVGGTLRLQGLAGPPAQVSGNISGSGTIRASGEVILSGSNTYTGTTFIEGGSTTTLRVDGSQPSSSVSFVGSGATLTGNGVVGPVNAASSTVMPAPPGMLTTGSFATGPGGRLALLLSGTEAGVSYSQLRVNGSVTIASNAPLILTVAYQPAMGDSFVLVDNDGADPVSGTFSGLPEGAELVVAGSEFRITYAGGDGNDVVLTCTAPANSWTGGVSGSWSASGNWTSGVPTTGAVLAFPASGANKTMVNDLPSGTVFKRLTFTAPGYTLSGNDFGVTTAITGSASASTSVSAGMRASANGLAVSSITLNGPLDTAGRDVTITLSTVNGSVTNVSGTLTVARSTVNGNVGLTGTLRLQGQTGFSFTPTAVTGVIAGSGSVQVVSGGVGLSGNNTYTGTTTIGGPGMSLSVNGVQPSSPVVFSGTNSTLLGHGTIGDVNATGNTFNPTSPGVLSTGNATLGTLVTRLAGPVAGVGYTQLHVSGSVTITGTAVLQTALQFVPATGQVFVVVENDGTDAVTGTFAGLPEGATLSLNGYPFQISYQGKTGNDIILTNLAGDPSNRAPAAAPDSYVVSTGATLVVSAPGVLANDTDTDGDTLVVSPASGASARGGSFTLAADGSFVYTPPTSFSGVDTLTYVISDGKGGADTATVTITVIDGADMTLTNSAPASIVAGSPIPYTVTLTNNGPLAAGGIIWSATLPANTGFVSLAIPAPQSDWSCSTPSVGAAGLVSCSYLPVSLPASTSKVFTLAAATFCGIPYTTLSTTATVITGSTVDPVPGNNSQMATTTVTSGVIFAGVSSAASQGTCTIRTTWNAATAGPCTKTSRISYNVYRSTSAVFTPSAGNRVASCVTGNGSTISYQDNSGLTSGTTYYYIVRAEDQLTPGTGPCGGTEDGNTVTVSATAPVTCAGASNPNPIQVTTVTSTSGQNVIEWLNPSSGPYGGIGTTVRYSTTSFPQTPIDGLNVGSVVGSLGGKSKLTHTGLSNATTHYYSLFVDGGAGVLSSGRSVDGRPFATPGQVFWSFSTAGSALNPVQTSPGSTGAVYGPSNDRYIHAMKRGGAGGGPWPTGGPWKPYALNMPSADRVLVVDTTLVAGSTRVVYASSPDGKVYAVDGPTGAARWSSVQNAPGDALTGAPARLLVNGGAAYNLVLVGTRSTTTGNRLLGLDPGTGATRFAYDGGGGLGIISSEVAPGATNNRVYFTSRGTPSVSCVQVSGPLAAPVASACAGFTAPAIGDVDGPPTLFQNTLYVGANDGKVYALDATTGAVLWSVDPADGAVRGRIYRDNATSRIWFATATKVWGYFDNFSSGMLLFSAPIAGGSSPVLYNGRVYVGSSNGSIYEMDAATGGSQKSVVLGLGTAQVGAPSIDSTSSVVYAGTEDGKTYSLVVPF